MDALQKTRVVNTVQLLNVHELAESVQSQIQAVPVIVSGGATLVGTAAFEWLRQFDSEMELEAFATGDGLQFSSVDDSASYAQSNTGYSPFQ